MFRPLSSPRWGPSSLARTLMGTLLHRRHSLRVLGGARPISVGLYPLVTLLLVFQGICQRILYPWDMSDLNPYELLKQLSYLFEVKDQFFAPALVGVLYLFHHQLGITPYLQLISSHRMGKIKPSDDSFVLDSCHSRYAESTKFIPKFLLLP